MHAVYNELQNVQLFCASTSIVNSQLPCSTFFLFVVCSLPRNLRKRRARKTVSQRGSIFILPPFLFLRARLYRNVAMKVKRTVIFSNGRRNKLRGIKLYAMPEILSDGFYSRTSGELVTLNFCRTLFTDSKTTNPRRQNKFPVIQKI